MQQLGDYVEDATLDFKWSTNDSNGASITRATNGTVSVYKANGVVQSVAGITDTEDFDSTTGIHHCRIDLSADAFYAVGNDYQVVLSGAVIDGQTVNAVLAHFSIENRFSEVDVVKWLGQACVAVGVNGVPVVDMTHIHGSALTETAGQLAGRFVDFFDQASAAFDVATALASFKATGFSTHDANDVRVEMDANSTMLSSISDYVDSLEARLTAARAGYLDELAAANLPADVDTLVSRLTTARAEVLSDLIEGGRLDLLIDAIKAKTDAAPGAAMVELTGIADAPATPSQEQALMLLYMWLRNDTASTATERRIKNDAGTEIMDAAMSDDATTFSQGKLSAP